MEHNCIKFRVFPKLEVDFEGPIIGIIAFWGL